MSDPQYGYRPKSDGLPMGSPPNVGSGGSKPTIIESNAAEIAQINIANQELRSEIARLRSLMSWVQSCDGIGTFRKRDCREVVISFDSSEAGMAAFEAISDFIEAARAALGGNDE